MTIEQTVEIPSNYRLLLELPRTIPVGVSARVKIHIPLAIKAQKSGKFPEPTKSFRGILKGRGVTLERFAEMQREDKVLEEQ